MIVLIKNNIILNKFNTNDTEKAKSICEKNNIDYLNCTFQNIEVIDYTKILDGITRIEQIQNNDVININEALNRKLLELKDNEIIFNDRIIYLPSTHKIVHNEIIEKTLEEKLIDNVITSEEYNKIQNEKREREYESKTDKQVIELMRNFLNKNKDSLSDEDKSILDSINSEIDTIKQEYPKQS